MNPPSNPYASSRRRDNSLSSSSKDNLSANETHRQASMVAEVENPSNALSETSPTDRVPFPTAEVVAGNAITGSRESTEPMSASQHAVEGNSQTMQQLHEQIRALQNQVETLQETNFDLEATMATMQAEQQYSITKMETKRKEETSKLQHALRLEQQTTQRLLVKHQQQNLQPSIDIQSPPQLNQNKRYKTNSSSNNAMDAFSRRLPSAPSRAATTSTLSTHIPTSAANQDDPMDADDNGGPDPFASHTDPPTVDSIPKEISTSGQQAPSEAGVKSPRPSRRSLSEQFQQSRQNAGAIHSTKDYQYIDSGVGLQGTAYLAYHLLQLGPTDEAHDHVRHVLLLVVQQQQHGTRIKNARGKEYTEAEVLEFLLQHSTVEYWKPALILSGAGRRAILQAMEHIQRQEFPDSKSNKEKKKRKPRLHRINPDGSTGECLDSMRDTQASYMDSFLVKQWVGVRLDKLNPAHLDCLSTILDECPDHSTTIWWNIIVPGISLVLIQLHYQLVTYKMQREQMESTVDSTLHKIPHKHKSIVRATKKGASLHRALSNKSNGTVLNTRQFRFRCPAVQEEEMLPEQVPERLLHSCLRLMACLLRVTSMEVLEAWYTREQDLSRIPLKQPYQMVDRSSVLAALDEQDESPYLWLGLLLDIVEGFTFDYKKEVNMPEWYTEFIRFLQRMATTEWGIATLRTRLPAESKGNDVLPNALDVGILHLFHLSLSDDNDAVDYQTEAHLNRIRLQDDWIRLWHEVLLFVQQQPHHLPEKATEDASRKSTPQVQISFRSLILDLEDFFTAAYARILADSYVRRDVRSMIRIQLEELSMDEEEYAELNN